MFKLLVGRHCQTATHHFGQVVCQPPYSLLHSDNFSITNLKRQVHRFAPLAMAPVAVQPLLIGVFTSCASLSGVLLSISIAFSLQKRALAGRLRERKLARSSSVISGLALSASIVICNLSGLAPPSLGTATRGGAAFTLFVFVCTGVLSSATTCPVIVRCASSFVSVVSDSADSSSVGRLTFVASKLAGLRRDPEASALCSVVTGRRVCFASSLSRPIWSAAAFLSSAADSVMVSAIIV